MAQNDDQLQQQYQEILNKYASSITPPEPTSPSIETPVENQIIKPKLNTSIISDTNFTDSQINNVSKVETPVVPVLDSLIPEPVVSKLIIKEEPIVPPIYFPPEPIINKPSNFFKYLFYFSLLLFIAVASAVVYTAIPTPTKIISQFCELGDKKYAIDESFLSSDGCNTCSCTSNLTIACTQKACLSPTPTVE